MPLDDMPVYRLELDLAWLAILLGAAQSFFGDYDFILSTVETTWFALKIVDDQTPGSSAADLYRSMFLPPSQVHVLPTAAPGKAAAILSLITDLSHLPVAGPSDLAQLVDSRAEAEYLGVFNVGQGGANALLNACHQASLYYDLGCGVYRNAWSKPAGLKFCWSIASTVVLSHWDVDHWAGAQVPLPGSPPNAPLLPALTRDWIVPVQKIGPIHLAFANSIAPGRLRRLATSATRPIAGGRQLRLELGSGASRNHSGIVLLTENGAGGSAWLLSGDCDYKYFSGALPLNRVIALTAPHHGASLTSGSTPPSASGCTAESCTRLASIIATGNRPSPIQPQLESLPTK